MFLAWDFRWAVSLVWAGLWVRDLVNEVVGQIYLFLFGYLVNEVCIRDFVFLGCVWLLRKCKKSWNFFLKFKLSILFYFIVVFKISNMAFLIAIKIFLIILLATCVLTAHIGIFH